MQTSNSLPIKINRIDIIRDNYKFIQTLSGFSYKKVGDIIEIPAKTAVVIVFQEMGNNEIKMNVIRLFFNYTDTASSVQAHVPLNTTSYYVDPDIYTNINVCGLRTLYGGLTFSISYTQVSTTGITQLDLTSPNSVTNLSNFLP